jgi:hypothetical protein
MMAWKDQKRKLHFGVSDTGSWRSQESRLFITGVPKLRNAKRRNPETGTSTKTPFRVSSPECEMRKLEIKDSISEFRIPGVGGGVKSRDSSSQESRSCEMRNAEMKQAHQQS